MIRKRYLYTVTVAIIVDVVVGVVAGLGTGLRPTRRRLPPPVIILHVDAAPRLLASSHVHAEGGVTFTVIIINHGATAAAAATWSGISSNTLWGGRMTRRR